MIYNNKSDRTFNRLPVEQIVEYCIANNISIDDVLINNKNHSSSNMKNYKILNTEDYIRLENIFNEDYSSYIDNNHNIYIIKELREYTFEGYYLINVSEQKDEIICVNIKKKLDGNYAYSYFNDRDKEYELNSIEINNLNIVAKVIKIINFSTNWAYIKYAQNFYINPDSRNDNSIIFCFVILSLLEYSSSLL